MAAAAMNETPESENEAGSQPEVPVRKPWHAPRFIRTNLASTDAVCNAGHDGAPSAPSLS
jgi:hypothetical protein